VKHCLFVSTLKQRRVQRSKYLNLCFEETEQRNEDLISVLFHNKKLPKKKKKVTALLDVAGHLQAASLSAK